MQDKHCWNVTTRSKQKPDKTAQTEETKWINISGNTIKMKFQSINLFF